MLRTKRRSLTIFELSHLPKQVKLISFIMFVYFIGWGICNPFFPIYLNDILGSYTGVGLIFGALYLMGFFWNLLMGDISDKISKKSMIILTLFLYLPMGPVILLMRKFWDFVLYQVYHSFTSSSLWLGSEAFVRGHSPKHKTSESMGLFDMSWVLSVVIGSAISGFLFLKFGFSIFLFISVFSAFALVISFFIKDKAGKGFVSSTREVIVKDGIFKKEFLDFLKNKELLRFSILSFFVCFSFGFMDMVLPLFSKALNATPIQIGILFSLFFLPRLSEGYFSVLADKFGKKSILLKGFFFCSVFFLLMFFVKDLPLLFLFSSMLSFLGISVVLPPLMGRITELIPKREVGEMTGVTKSINCLGSGLSPIVAGVIADLFGLRYIFLLGSLVSVGLLIFVFRLKFE